MAESCQSSVRHVTRSLHALSEAAAQEQAQVFNRVLTYAKSRQPSGLRNVLLVEHIQHDETQTIVTASYPGGEAHTHTEGRCTWCKAIGP